MTMSREVVHRAAPSGRERLPRAHTPAGTTAAPAAVSRACRGLLLADDGLGALERQAARKPALGRALTRCLRAAGFRALT